MPLPKFIPGLISDQEDKWEFMGQEGYIQDNKIVFSVNIAPAELEVTVSTDNDVADYVKAIQDNIDYLSSFKKFIEMLNLHGDVEIDADFYWSEEDLNVRVSVPINHILFQSK